MTGNEVRHILAQNHINLAWLASELGITPQNLQSRLSVKNFKTGYLTEMIDVIGKDIFQTTQHKSNELSQPILDIRVCAGNGIGLEDDENKIIEYVSIPTFKGCTGITVYGDSMAPKYKSGDIIFVRPIFNISDIDFGHSYLIVTESDRLLKIIYQSQLGDEYFRLSSFNPEVNLRGDRLYPDRDIRLSNIKHIYKVIGSMTREQI